MTSPTFVLLRGLTREQRHWGNFPQQLLQHFPNARVITPDLPGNGSACRERSPATIAGMVESLRATLNHDVVDAAVPPPSRRGGGGGDQFNAFDSSHHPPTPSLEEGELKPIPLIPDHSPVVVIALSMGAMVTLEWMQRYPAEVKAAVLMSTSLKGVSPFHRRLRPTCYPFLLRALLFSTDPLERERAIFRLTSNLHQNDEALIKEWCRYANEYPVSRANAWRQLLAAARYRVPDEKPLQPMLLLAGKGDRLVNPQCSIELASHWQLPVELHPEAGHDLPLDAGEWVCEEVDAWYCGAIAE